MKNLVTELQWRGLVHDIMPGTEEQLLKEMTTTYIGFDPTSDSLHIGSLVPIILLVHLEKFGHKPIALVGGATGMIGDPSGKSDERNLLDEATLEKNVAGIKAVLSRFLDFNSTAANAPILVNNYDWMKDFSFINFARDVGKRITVNYMMAKDSVKKRLSGETGEGMSFTEFTYQLIQGYDFHHLYKTHNCLLQMGGSDQWGNITTGTELVRRINGEGAKAYAMTCPLITKADGSKFGKSEGGNVWLTADKTSVYKFYQFWLNTTDVDAKKYIKIFTFLDETAVTSLIAEHDEAPHLRVLQKRLAEEVTIFVHGKEELEKAIQVSNILFGNATTDELKQLDEATFLEVFEDFPKAEITRTDIKKGIDIISFLNEKSGFLKSKGEARRAIAENSISINRGKVNEDFKITFDDLINDKFVLIQRGKKNYFIVSLKGKVINKMAHDSLKQKIDKTKLKAREFALSKQISEKKKEAKNYALNKRYSVINFEDENKYREMFQSDNFLFLPKDKIEKRLKRKSWVSNIQIYSPIINGYVNAMVSNKIPAKSDKIAMSEHLKRNLGLEKGKKVSIIDKGNEIVLNIK